MRIQMEPTEILTELDGVQVRVWNGITEEGTQCIVFVHRIAVHKDDGTLEGLIDVPYPRSIGECPH